MIRAATPGDVAAITSIYAREVAAGTASFEVEPPGEAEMDRRLGELASGGYPILVFVEHARVLGFAYAGPYHRRAGFRFTLEDSVYVAAEARGRGVGARLLDALVAEGAERGFRRMVAVIGDGANAASIALHERTGFAHAGRLPQVGWKFGRWLDVVLMQRALGDADPT